MKTCPVCDTPYPDQHSTCPTDGAVLIESQELAAGHIVRGKYRITRKLGQGGMGVVYLAEHLMLGGQLALKFLASELSRNPQFIKRFRQEARAAYQLRHPNLVEVADLDQNEDGSLFIAMEYVAGPSLRSVLNQTPQGLPVERAMHIARGLAAGLSAAHARGAIHRDIKPENILLGTQPDGTELPKILDFGIAAMTDGITAMSQTHGLLLTPQYAAPEQWRGLPAAQLDGRTDLYALGGVFYEMLTGRTPYHAHNMEGWLYEHLQGVPEPIGNFRPELAREHPELESIIMCLLARDREQRYPSAVALLDALAPQSPAPPPSPRATAVEPSPVPAPQPAPQPVPQHFTQPAPQHFTQPAPQPAQQPAPQHFTQPAPQPAPPPKRSGTWMWAAAAIALVAGLGIWATLRLFATPHVVAVPKLNPPEGAYAEARSVIITDATPNAVIHYTLDGSRPSEASPIFNPMLPIASLPSHGVIRAMATAEGYTPSSEITGEYTWSASAQPAAKPTGSAAPDASVGSVYDRGISSYKHKQYAQARTLFTQACDGGEMGACNYLGFLYAKGLGGAADEQMARQVYGKACDQKTWTSCLGLGSLYQDDGNAIEARKYFKKACEGGLSEACDLEKATP